MSLCGVVELCGGVHVIADAVQCARGGISKCYRLTLVVVLVECE